MPRGEVAILYPVSSVAGCEGTQHLRGLRAAPSVSCRPLHPWPVHSNVQDLSRSTSRTSRRLICRQLGHPLLRAQHDRS